MTEKNMNKISEENVVRLAKPKKKGLLSLIFSRFLFILILLLLQAFLYIAFFIWLSQYYTVYTIFTGVLTLVMVIYLFMCRIDNSAKLTWLLIMAVFPVVGAVFLLFTQTNLGHRQLKEAETKLIDQTKTAIPQSEKVLKKLKEDGGDLEDLTKYMNRSGCFPVYENTDVTYYPLGENMFEDLLQELEKAKKYIFMEYFIIEEGYMWGRILEILTRKAAQGVDVRVMYDGMCEMSTLPVDYWKLLEKEGIRSKPFAPIKPVLSTHYNYRDHRKITVIDGETAFTGGVNLADEYINRIERFGHWKDTAVRVKGDAVKSFTLLFLQMWNIDEKEPEFQPWLQDSGYQAEGAQGFVMPYGDCPLDDEKAAEMVYMDILNRASDYVHILTP